MSLGNLLKNVNPLDVTAMAVAFGKMDDEAKKQLIRFIKRAAGKEDTSAFIKRAVTLALDHEDELERGEPIAVKSTVIDDRGHRFSASSGGRGKA